MEQHLATDEPWLTPPQLAKKFAVGVEKVLAWIRNGELRAVNVAQTLGGRPRWRISPAALEAFIRRRESAPSPPPRTTTRSYNWSRVDGRGKVLGKSDGRLKENVPHEVKVKRIALAMSARQSGQGAEWRPYVAKAVERYAEKTGISVDPKAVEDLKAWWEEYE
jgi:excisionase family DNA binding protein